MDVFVFLFLLVPATKIIRDFLYISYYDNIKTWMKYCACWDYGGLLQWLLFPIPIVFFSCMEQRYYALTTNAPAEITCPSIVVFFCSVYASEMNWMTYNQFFVFSAVLMPQYIPDWTNEAIFSLIISRTTLCISSNASKSIYFGASSIIFQLLYDPLNVQ